MKFNLSYMSHIEVDSQIIVDHGAEPDTLAPEPVPVLHFVDVPVERPRVEEDINNDRFG